MGRQGERRSTWTTNRRRRWSEVGLGPRGGQARLRMDSADGGTVLQIRCGGHAADAHRTRRAAEWGHHRDVAGQASAGEAADGSGPPAQEAAPHASAVSRPASGANGRLGRRLWDGICHVSPRAARWPAPRSLDCRPNSDERRIDRSSMDDIADYTTTFLFGGCRVSEKQLKLIWMTLLLLLLFWIGWNLMRLSQSVVA